MEEELAEAKAIVKDILLDITMKPSVFYHIEQVRSWKSRHIQASMFIIDSFPEERSIMLLFLYVVLDVE